MKKSNTQDQRVNEWATLVRSLRPLERLALIGLLEMDDSLVPQKVIASNIVGENKCRMASDWLSRNIRPALYCYCEFCSTLGRRVGGDASNTTSLIVAFAGFLTTTLAISMPAALAFSGWALQAGLTIWCKKYGKIFLSGHGTWEIGPYQNSGSDLPHDTTTRTYKGAFSATYFPPIKSSVRDERYKHPLHEVKMHKAADLEGYFMPSTSAAFPKIAEFCRPVHVHRFKFSDNESSRIAKGEVRVEGLSKGFSIESLKFAAQDVLLEKNKEDS